MHASYPLTREQKASFAELNDTTYEQLLERGMSPEQAAATYEWECIHCSTRTWRSAAGGTVDCVCEDKSDQDMRVHRMFAGQREDLGFASEMAGRRNPKRDSARTH